MNKWRLLPKRPEKNRLSSECTLGDEDANSDFAKSTEKRKGRIWNTLDDMGVKYSTLMELHSGYLVFVPLAILRSKRAFFTWLRQKVKVLPCP